MRRVAEIMINLRHARDDQSTALQCCMLLKMSLSSCAIAVFLEE